MSYPFTYSENNIPDITQRYPEGFSAPHSDGYDGYEPTYDEILADEAQEFGMSLEEYKEYLHNTPWLVGNYDHQDILTFEDIRFTDREAATAYAKENNYRYLRNENEGCNFIVK